MSRIKFWTLDTRGIPVVSIELVVVAFPLPMLWFILIYFAGMAYLGNIGLLISPPLQLVRKAKVAVLAFLVQSFSVYTAICTIGIVVVIIYGNDYFSVLLSVEAISVLLFIYFGMSIHKQLKSLAKKELAIYGHVFSDSHITGLKDEGMIHSQRTDLLLKYES
jgi:hypothetical protein